jgi:hypothetical protein
MVSLNGASTLNLVLSGATGDTWTNCTIPLSGSFIPPGVVDAVEQAGASILTPVAGPASLPLTVKGSVADPGQLSALGLNGQDILDQVKKDDSFSVQVPGTTKMLSLAATDTKGASETQNRQIGAGGIRISRVRFNTRAVVRKHRLRVTVTTTDRLG